MDQVVREWLDVLQPGGDQGVVERQQVGTEGPGSPQYKSQWH